MQVLYNALLSLSGKVPAITFILKFFAAFDRAKLVSPEGMSSAYLLKCSVVTNVFIKKKFHDRLLNYYEEKLQFQISVKSLYFKTRNDISEMLQFHIRLFSVLNSE